MDNIDIRFKSIYTEGDAYSVIQTPGDGIVFGYDGGLRAGVAPLGDKGTIVSGRHTTIEVVDEVPVLGIVYCPAINVEVDPETAGYGDPSAITKISGKLLYNDKEVATKEDITNAGGGSVDLGGVEFTEGSMTLPTGADGYDILVSGNLSINPGTDSGYGATPNILSYDADIRTVKLGGIDVPGGDPNYFEVKPVIEGSNIKLQVYPGSSEYNTGAVDAIVIEGDEDIDNICTVAKTYINGELYYNGNEVATKEDITAATGQSMESCHTLNMARRR